MSIVAKEQTNWVLSTFKSDSTGCLETSKTLAEEVADSPVSKYNWFIYGHRCVTVGRRMENRFFGVYCNSFSKRKSKITELGKPCLMKESNKNPK